jgi:hypothetical protein
LLGNCQQQATESEGTMTSKAKSGAYEILAAQKSTVTKIKGVITLCQGVGRPQLILARWLPKFCPAIRTMPSSGRSMLTLMLVNWLIL